MPCACATLPDRLRYLRSFRRRCTTRSVGRTPDERWGLASHFVTCGDSRRTCGSFAGDPQRVQCHRQRSAQIADEHSHRK